MIYVNPNTTEITVPTTRQAEGHRLIFTITHTVTGESKTYSYGVYTYTRHSVVLMFNLWGLSNDDGMMPTGQYTYTVEEGGDVISTGLMQVDFGADAATQYNPTLETIVYE